MQGLTDPPRGHLTADQVRMLLTGEDVQRDHGAELLDENNQVIEDLGQDCRDWTVTYTSGTGEEIHGSVSLDTTRLLDWGRVRVRPYVDLTASELATVTETVIDRPGRSVSQTSNDAAGWAAGPSLNVDGASGVLQLAEAGVAWTARPDVPGLLASFEAEDLGVADGAQVASLPSGGSSSVGWAAQPGGAPTFRTGGANGRGYLEQSGTTGTGLQWMVDLRNTASTVVYVARNLGSARVLSSYTNWLVGWQGGGRGKMYANGWVATGVGGNLPAAEIYTGVSDQPNDTYSLYANGQNLATNNAGASGPNGLTTNGLNAASEFSDSEFYAVFVYDHVLTDTERVNLHSYLADRYGIATADYQPVPGYATSGEWMSPALDLTTLQAITSSLVEWTATVPAGTSVAVETSTDGGATWQPAADGDTIAGAAPGGTAQAQITLTGDGASTPEVSALTLSASQAELSHVDISRQLVPFTGRFYAGVYVLTVPDTHHGRDPLVYDAAGKNLMYLLDRNVGNTYRLGDPDDGPVPTYLDALRKVIANAGLSIPVLLDGDRQDATLPKPRVWVDPRWVDIANDLMAEIAYTDLYSNEVGTYRAQPISPLEQRPAEWTFDTEDQATDLIDGDFVESQDLHAAYNTWTFVQADLPYQPVEGDGLFIVPPPEGTPASEVRPAPLQEIQAADQKALEAEGLRIVAADQRLEHEFRINVDPLPIAGHRDVVLFRHDGREVKLQATTWQLTPYGKAAWTLGGGTGGATPQRAERQTKATVTQATADVNGNPLPGPLRVVVDGATVDSLATALADDSGVVPIYKLGTRVRVTVRNPEIPLVQGKET